MMINKRLISLVPDSLKYIISSVVVQWLSLCVNVVLMYHIASLLTLGFDKNKFALVIVCVLIRAAAIFIVNRLSYQSSKEVKRIVREKIYSKLLKLGSGYDTKISTSEVVQLSVEGVEQLETYFGAYLPQFFYAMLAPLTLFLIVSFINFPTALVLLICVPLIPVTIAKIQRWAKKLLGKYWDQYTSLGDSFLENLQGLTTLKIYQADEYKNGTMNIEAEHFRQVTMKVLTMQLNSVTIMDFITYLGVALGVILSTTAYKHGSITITQCILIILLSADFFLPMRQLGSYFHVAMNGMAATDKIFALLDLEEQEEKNETIEEDKNIEIRNLSYAYTEDKKVLEEISMEIPDKGYIAIVGESGCGKSTLAKILIGTNPDYEGSITVGNKELCTINEQNLLENITYISGNSYLFKGTVKENLLVGDSKATEEEMWDVLDKVNLKDFLESEKGLNTMILEGSVNLSGGQRQRLALARALLHQSDIYIFDEATSNIDAESEESIMTQIHALTKKKTVILISHRLFNVTDADCIYVLEEGRLCEQGRHEDLLRKEGVYQKLWDTQQKLENYGKAVD